MIVTLCGSARFEDEFKRANEQLSLAGHVVFTLSVYPSDKNNKSWYTDKQKETLDKVHFEKIRHSDAVVLIAPGGYVGESTSRELAFAHDTGLPIYCAYQGRDEFNGVPIKRICPYPGCADPLVNRPPCPICYD